MNGLDGAWLRHNGSCVVPDLLLPNSDYSVLFGRFGVINISDSRISPMRVHTPQRHINQCFGQWLRRRGDGFQGLGDATRLLLMRGYATPGGECSCVCCWDVRIVNNELFGALMSRATIAR